MFNVSIPRISDNEMMRRYRVIKPVAKWHGNLRYFRDFSIDEIRNRPYLFEIDRDIGQLVKPGELRPMEGSDFICIHNYGYYELFSPRVGDVLSQIDNHMFMFARAFEIIDNPKDTSEYYKDELTTIIHNSGYHISKIRLYQ